MAMNYEAMISYFNYGIIAMLVLGVIFGFFKGLFKSVYNLIIFVVLLLIGWFLSPLFSNMIINYDVSSYGFEISGVALTTLGEFIKSFATTSFTGIEGALVEGTLAMELVNAFMVMVVRIVFLIIWLILMATVFKFIFWIVYLIIKPRKIKKDGSKRKKTLVSRLGGMGVSLVHTFIFILMLSIPLAGITSIGSSLSSLAPVDEGDPTQLGYSYNLVYTNNGMLLATEDDGLNDAIKFMENYRETYAGKIAGFAKIGETYLDEAIFDEIISLKTQDNKIKLRYELKIAVNVYSTLLDELNGKPFTAENITNIDSTVLDGIIEEISKLELIHVAIPVGLELAVNSTMFDEQLGDIADLVDLETLLVDLQEVDYEEEIQNLGKAFFATLALIEEMTPADGEEINYLGLSADKIDAVTGELSQSEILEILSDVALAYLINSEGFISFMEENGRSADDIDITDVKITEELASLSAIYRAFTSAGFTSLDLETLDLEAVTDADINGIGDAIYSSKFFSKNSVILADFLIDALPDDYKQVLTVNDFNKQDFVSILSLGVVMAKSGMLGNEFDPLEVLTTDNIEKIADYISKSDLLSDNVQGLINLLLEGMDLPIDIVFPEELTWKGEEGKAELISLFTTAEKIVGMMDSEGGFDFTKDKIDALSETIVDSKVLMHNVDALLDYILETTAVSNGIDFVIPGDINWEDEAGKTEFKNLLNAVSVLLDSGILDNPDFATLSDGTVDTNGDSVIDENDENIIGDLAKAMSDSRVIRENLSPILNSALPTDYELELFTDPNDWTFTELNSLLRSAKILMGNPGGFSMDLILELDETEIDIIVSSKIIVDNVVKMLEDLTKPLDDTPAGSLNGILYLPVDNVDYNGVDGELKKFIIAAQIILAENTAPGAGLEELNTISLSSLTGTNQATILASKIMNETIINNIVNISNDSEVIKLHPDFDRSVPTYVVGTWEAELPKLLNGVMVFLGETGNIHNIDISSSAILNISDTDITTVTDSKILSYSIVNYIEEEGGKPESFISLPNDLNPLHVDYDNNLWYGTSGELVKALKALRELGMADFSADIDLTKVYNEAKGATPEVILASRVVEATIINKIETEAATGGSLAGTLIIPAGTVWEKTYTDNVVTDQGELRRFLVAIEILIGSTSFNNAEFKVENLFNTVENPTRQDTLLESVVMEATIINTIETEASTGTLNGTLIIPNDIVWERTYTGEVLADKGELRRFLGAIEILLGGKTFTEAEFKVESLFNSVEDPTRQDRLLESRIMEASIVNTIETEASTGTLHGTLIIPSDIIWERTFTGEVVTDKGELRRFLGAIEILLGGKTFSEAEFKVESLFNTVEEPTRQDKLLESRIMEASIVNTVETEMAVGGSLNGKLVKPAGFVETDWYGTNGELVKFLASIEKIIGTSALSTASFDVDTILGPDQEVILDSRVVEASAIKFIKDSSNLVIPDSSLVSTFYYLSNETLVWDRSDTDGIGELRRFLTGIDSLMGGSTFATYTFTMNAMLDTDFTNILPSRVLEATIAKTIDDLLSSGALNGFILEPVDGYQWYYHATSSDSVRNGTFELTTTPTYQRTDLLGFITSIQMMEATNLNFNSLTFANVKATDSTALSDALWNYSRVMRGSVATMLNKILADASIPYSFPEDYFDSQAKVKQGLDFIQMF